jgi:L-lactate dehydrogenase complex protein LldF
MSALGWLGRRHGSFFNLPLASGWTATREFPAPQGRTFQDLWRERRRAGGGS